MALKGEIHQIGSVRRPERRRARRAAIRRAHQTFILIVLGVSVFVSLTIWAGVG